MQGEATTIDNSAGTRNRGLLRALSLRLARRDKLASQLRLLRWWVPLLVLLLAVLHEGLLGNLSAHLAGPLRPASTSILLYGFTGSLAAWAGLTWLASQVAKREEAEAELRQAFDQLGKNHAKLLALHDLSSRVTKAEDEQAVLEIATRAPVELTGAQASTVITFGHEKSNLKLGMSWGLSDDYLDVLRRRLDDGVPAGRCSKCNALAASVDSGCPLFAGIEPNAKQEGIRSLVCLPMEYEKERVGIIAAYFPSADGPPQDQIRLLNIFGGSITGTLDGLRARAQHLSTLAAFGRDKLEESEFDPVEKLAKQTLAMAVSAWNADAGALFMVEPGNETWTCKAQHNIGTDIMSEAMSATLLLARTALDGTVHLYPNLESEAFFAVYSGGSIRSAAVAPLLADGTILGVLVLTAEEPGAFRSRHAELLSVAAQQSALAIRNAQLYDQLSQMAVVEERLRLSREIHDGLAQTMSYLSLKTERLENVLQDPDAREEAAVEIRDLRQAVRTAYVDIREAIDGLRLSVGQPEQISDRLRELVTEFSRQSPIRAELEIQPERLVVTPKVSLQLLRIAQEALTNARKHSQADRVRVKLLGGNDELELVVADDGRGLPAPRAQDQRSRTHGLTSMRERAASLGGSLSIATGPDQGTRITVTAPLEGQA